MTKDELRAALRSCVRVSTLDDDADPGEYRDVHGARWQWNGERCRVGGAGWFLPSHGWPGVHGPFEYVGDLPTTEKLAGDGCGDGEA